VYLQVRVVAVLRLDALVQRVVPVDDDDDLDVVVRLRTDALEAVLEVFVHVFGVRTDDDRDLHRVSVLSIGR